MYGLICVSIHHYYYNHCLLVIPEVKLANPVDGGTQFIVNQSYPVNISCSSEGLPRPSLTWYKGDTLLSSDLLSASVEDTTILSTGTVHRREQTFIITSAQVSDTSSYRCTGSNVAGQDTVNFTVFVQGTVAVQIDS